MVLQLARYAGPGTMAEPNWPFVPGIPRPVVGGHLTPGGADGPGWRRFTRLFAPRSRWRRR